MPEQPQRHPTRPPAPWFGRRFAPDTPPAKLPDLVERLRGTPLRATALTESVDGELLTRRVDGQWSVQTNIGHLLVLESLWHGRVQDLAEGAEVLREADLENTATDQADFDQREMAEILAGFAAERARLVQRIEAVPEPDWSRAALHPRLQQPMRLVDLCLFVADHDDHHLAQVTRLLRFLGS